MNPTATTVRHGGRRDPLYKLCVSGYQQNQYGATTCFGECTQQTVIVKQSQTQQLLLMARRKFGSNPQSQEQSLRDATPVKFSLIFFVGRNNKMFTTPVFRKQVRERCYHRGGTHCSDDTLPAGSMVEWISRVRNVIAVSRAVPHGASRPPT